MVYESSKSIYFGFQTNKWRWRLSRNVVACMIVVMIYDGNIRKITRIVTDVDCHTLLSGTRVSILYRDVSRKQYIASFVNIAILQYSENIMIF